MKNIILLALVLGFNVTHAAPKDSQPRIGIFEKFCVNSKIMDACEKAVERLSAKIVSAPEVEQSDLQERLRNVITTECQLGHQESCKSLGDLPFSTLQAEFAAEPDSELAE